MKKSRPGDDVRHVYDCESWDDATKLSDDVILGSFRRKMKEARQEQGLTQKGLADAAEVSVDTIKLYEKKDANVGPRLETAYRIASALNMPLSALLPTCRESMSADTDLLEEIKKLISEHENKRKKGD